jgi:hypothetical protein
MTDERRLSTLKEVQSFLMGADGEGKDSFEYDLLAAEVDGEMRAVLQVNRDDGDSLEMLFPKEHAGEIMCCLELIEWANQRITDAIKEVET